MVGLGFFVEVGDVKFLPAAAVPVDFERSTEGLKELCPGVAELGWLASSWEPRGNPT